MVGKREYGGTLYALEGVPPLFDEETGEKLCAVLAKRGARQISRIRLIRDLTSGVVEEVITNDLFQAPTTATLLGNRMAVVNAKIDTGLPPKADQYEVIVVDR
jgi:hypothetical protein